MILKERIDALLSGLNYSRESIGLSVFHIPFLRAQANEGVIRVSELTNRDVEKGSYKHVRRGTLQHNRESLYGGLKNYDRGSQLTRIAWSIIPEVLHSHLRVLHIGPRNVNEVLLSCSFSGVPENIEAIDLIPIDGIVQQADMHKLDYPDNSFDLILLGWVLGYSTDPSKALSEIFRVSKKDSVIGVGWDVDFPSLGSSDDTHLSRGDEVYHYRDTESFFSLLKQSGLSVSTVHASIDPTPPYNFESQRGIVVFSPNKRPINSFSFNGLMESVAVSRVRRVLSQTHDSLPQIIEHRLKIHELQAASDFTASHDMPAYLAMRLQSRLLSDTTDELLTEVFSSFFPWPAGMFSSEAFNSLYSLSGGGWGGPKDIEVAIGEINRKAHYKFPFLVPEEILDLLDQALTASVDMVNPGRSLASEKSLLSDFCIKKVAFSRELISLSGSWLRCTPIFNSVVGMITNPIRAYAEGELIDQLDRDAQRFHHDKDRIKWINFFFYLSDVNSEDDGAHVIIPNTPAKGSPKDGRYSSDEIKHCYGVDDRSAAIPILGRRGTFFCADTRNLHRGSRVAHGQRRVIEVIYTNSLFGAETQKLSTDVILPTYGALAESHPRIFFRFL